MRFLASLLLLLPSMAPVALADDWPMFRFDETHQGYVGTANTDFAVFRQAWWNNVTISDTVKGSPVVKDSRVFIGAWDGNLYAFDSESGNLLWKNSTGAKISSTPAVSESFVYVVSEVGRLISFNARTGRLEREASVGNTFGSPVVHERRVFVGNEAGSLSAYDGDTLNLVWTFNTAGRYFNTTIAAEGIEGAPAVYNGQVLFGARNHYFYGVSEQGKGDKTTTLNWFFKAGGAIRSSPAVDKTNSRVLFGSQDGRLWAVGLAGTGNVTTAAWSHQQNAGPGLPSQIQSSPAIAYGKAFVGANNGNVVAVSLTNGQLAWTNPFATGGQVISSPAAVNKFVVVGSSDRRLYLLHEANGTVAWNQTATAPIEASAAVAGTQAFWAATDGSLYSWGGQKPPRADLSLTQLLAGTLYVGQSGSILATVANVGILPAPASSVQLFDGKNLVATEAVPALGAGNQTEIVFAYAPTLTGSISLKARVDPTNEIKELDEANNERTVTASVASAPTTSAAPTTTEEPGIPGFEALALAAAFAIAFHAWGRRRP